VYVIAIATAYCLTPDRTDFTPACIRPVKWTPWTTSLTPGAFASVEPCNKSPERAVRGPEPASPAWLPRGRMLAEA